MATKTKRSPQKISKRNTRPHGTGVHAKKPRSAAAQTLHHLSRTWLFGTGITLLIMGFGIVFAKWALFASVDAAAGNTLSVSGSAIVDATGHTKILRGAMLETSFAYYKQYFDQHQNPLDKLNSKTFGAMQSWGMNAVRINISQWIQQADTSGQYLPRLDTAIAAANQAGLYVILDFHNDGQSGAQPPYDDGKLHKVSETWWVSIANRYKSNNMVLFDLVNEPKYGDWHIWGHGDGKDVVGLLDVTAAIRQAGAQNIVVLEPGAAAGSQLKGWQGFTASAITDKNSIVSKHDYSSIPAGYLSPDAAKSWAQEWGPFIGIRPLYYGEWAVLPHPNYPVFCKGVTSSNADAVVNAFLVYMKSIGASWTAWSFTPTEMIDSFASLQPTSMQAGAPWTCPVTSGPGLGAGMGADVKAFLGNDSIPGSSKLKEVIAKGDTMIGARLQGLGQLLQKIAASTRLSSADKTALQNEVNNEVHGLTSAKSKLDSETSLSAAQADVAALATEYKVYQFLTPKVEIITAADWQQTIEANLAVLAAKLQGRIGQDQQLQALLNDMDKHVSTAKAMSAAVEKGVLPLQDSDYVKDHTLFAGYISRLQQAHADSAVANADAQKIIDVLKKGGGGGSCTHTGVSGGSSHYTFAPLSVNAQGVVVDAHNPSCTIHLAGLNQGWWTAETTGDPVSAKTTMDFLTQHLHYNIIRVAFNSRWVKDNPPDPAYGGQLFRPAFDSFIQMAKQHGLYVELDLDSQFVLPPCDPKTPHCSKPNQGAIDWDDLNSKYFHDMKGEELSAYQPTALAALDYLAKTYKNDPAILFNVWNEPAPTETKMPIPNSNPPARGPISEDTFFKDMQERVTAVTNVTQDHLTIVYVRALSDIMGPSHYPIFSQKNIMYDVHIYQKNFDQNNLLSNVSFAHSHGQAFVVGEWGGAPGQPDPSTFVPILRANNINSTYFAGSDLYDGSKKNPSGLNAIGQAVDTQYQAIFKQ